MEYVVSYKLDQSRTPPHPDPRSLESLVGCCMDTHHCLSRDAAGFTGHLRNLQVKARRLQGSLYIEELGMYIYMACWGGSRDSGDHSTPRGAAI